MDIHQKNVRQQEQERQWKHLQAMRAREQQIQQMQAMPEKIHGKIYLIVQRNSIILLLYFGFKIINQLIFQWIQRQIKCKSLLIITIIIIPMMQPMERLSIGKN